ncbi:DDE-type integrase/transposase/recombinase [Ruegeria sediminis]|uniref:DDE-type integrase/transposase/recombinase n=1 Tax=Ruegeria sediminis TaxID=2583820 RepID=A0ABY2X3W1_9RHOB|nr:DDE-type integrase/transposase/recombinase [Ruegeria sediminis]TMV10084.1 DDE-type integrase/transposase/recombinase [Ruegeria sediminis]
MTLFKNLTESDRVTFEGSDVWKVTPKVDPKTKEITHYVLAVYADSDAQIRTFCPDEITLLIEAERLVIDRGYYSLKRVEDRRMQGRKELYLAGKKQRESIGRKVFLAERMAHYRRLGMTLTREGVGIFTSKIDADYRQFQARVKYGTEKANSSQALHPLPCSDTLLGYLRKYENADCDPNVFNTKRVSAQKPVFANDDFNFVMNILRDYARGGPGSEDSRPVGKSSKREIAQRAVKEVAEENARRAKQGPLKLIPVKSVRTYERYIDEYLDPFTVVLQREGLAAATRKFGMSEAGMSVSTVGENVQFDAWCFHVVTLDVTRAEYERMTEEERAKVKRVRRWVVVAIDVASRIILGYSICRSPNQKAALEALRSCFMDKTYLFRNAGITDSDWDHVCPIQLVSTDSGSEFGKHPFGGAEFSAAVKRLHSSFMNTTAGVANLRGHIERWFRTCELKFARTIPGWTASMPSKLNDRKPHEEACVTDDELDLLFVIFIAEYHNTPHRGLNGKTPATAWEELTQDIAYDPMQIPGPQDLREACGFSTTARVTHEGIRFAGTTYLNEFIRNDRKTRVADRVAAPDGTVEIIVDPMDMGAISVVGHGDTISVPALDSSLRGKTLRQWQEERQLRRAEAALDGQHRSGARDEAQRRRAELVGKIMRGNDMGMTGYTQTELDRASLELSFGKGSNEEPFVGRDEYDDPIYGGFETDASDVADEAEVTQDADVEDEHGVNSVVLPDEPGSLDRFRTSKKFSR